jgi:hypothetical protein
VTGPEHYREAERLLASLSVVGNPSPAQSHQVQLAQVHATLALAAAAALHQGELDQKDLDDAERMRAASRYADRMPAAEGEASGR